jgi:hypothetical protein
LVWGVNDFDEAAEMPYALDLVRLATSGLLAGSHHKAEFIISALLGGYARGLKEPGPAVLDRQLAWLRETVMVPEGHRQEFWDNLKKKRKKYEARNVDERPKLPPRYEATLRAALPLGSSVPVWAAWDGLAGSRRRGGVATGSSGRPKASSPRLGRGCMRVADAPSAVSRSPQAATGLQIPGIALWTASP